MRIAMLIHEVLIRVTILLSLALSHFVLIKLCVVVIAGEALIGIYNEVFASAFVFFILNFKQLILEYTDILFNLLSILGEFVVSAYGFMIFFIIENRVLFLEEVRINFRVFILHLVLVCIRSFFWVVAPDLIRAEIAILAGDEVAN